MDKMKSVYKYLILSILLVSPSCFDIGGKSHGVNTAVYQYSTPDQINVFLEEVHSQYPAITKIEEVGKSESGRVINALIVSNNPGTLEGEPAVRLTGGIHGDELAGIELLIRFIKYLTSNYASDSAVSDLVNSRYICIIPVLNPDGLAADTRYNKNGVDLNRNFNDKGKHWTLSGTVHGESAFSESETQALVSYSSTKNFNVSITYHVGAVLVNMPFDYGSEEDGVYPVEYNLVKSYAKTYTKTGSFLLNPDIYVYAPYMDEGTINGGDWYVAYGTLQDWSYTETGCLDLTIEVADSNPDTDAGVQEIFMYNRDSLMAYISKTEEGVNGKITDNISGDPLADVTITVSCDWNKSGTAVTGDLVVKTDTNGFYNIILLPGTYNVTYTKSNYQSKTLPVEITETGKTINENVTLTSI